MKKMIAAAAVLVVLAGAGVAQARVDFNLNIDVPAAPARVAVPSPGYPAYPAHPDCAQDVVASEAPQFIYSPPLGFYVSVGLPYDVVHIDNGYYLQRGGYWYSSPTYRGPWSIVSARWLPPALHRHRYDQIRHYRDREYRAYLHDRDHYRGRWYRPVAVTERTYERREEPRYDRRDERRERRDGRWDHR